ncbi:dienelactone hydrolase family protein [Neolewinella sp.]|uniref:carboxylesterase family protein n=1 Tax=Neolewinella sp. TaxID=2993543 RepID=UPI003B5171E3
MRLLLILLLCPFLLPAQWKEQLIDLGADTMHYLVSYPEGYEQDTADWPLVLFLHGGGESGADLSSVKRGGLPQHITEGEQFPFITLAPQNRLGHGFWDLVGLTQLLDDFTAHQRVDAHRIYLTGASRGGLGAWMLAMQNPGRFAALAPVCGAVPHSYAVWIEEDLPIWIFHGTDDQSIYPSETIAMVEQLRQKNMKHPVKLTMYEGVAHNAWDYAYADPELYKWLLAQRRD